MVNLTRSIVEHNIDEFEEGEVILFVTLEDDIFKLFRRFSSIFGNYKYSVLKKLFKKSYELSKLESEEQTENTSIAEKIQAMFVNVTHTSILKTTKEKIGIVLKHCSENTFSPADLGRFIDQLAVEGHKVKMIVLDYIDTMSPTIQRYGSYDDYNAQGQIVQELRSLSRQYKIPIITATQNKRESENVSIALNNSQVGDSIKKVRYADYIYMGRMRDDLDLFSSPVKEHIFSFNDLKNGIDSSILNAKDTLSEKLVPFELKITKSKESKKDLSVFLLFCTDNLKLYNSLDEYLNDVKDIETNSKKLDNDINLLSNMVISSYISDDVITDDLSNLDEFGSVNEIPF